MPSIFTVPKYFKRLRNEAGVTTIEAAVIFPVFLFLIASAISLAQIFYSRLQVNDALRIAGRAAVMSSVQDINGGGLGCEGTAEARFHDVLARAEIFAGADSVVLYRVSTPGQTASDPPITGIHIQPNDVHVTCVLCPLLNLGGFDYRPSTSQFVPFESSIHNCWNELPDLP